MWVWIEEKMDGLQRIKLRDNTHYEEFPNIVPGITAFTFTCNILFKIDGKIVAKKISVIQIMQKLKRNI